MKAQRISIIGTGTWGIALARMLCLNGHQVTAWSAIPEEIEQLESSRTHRNLPGVLIPEQICFTTDIEEACTDQDLLIFAVPSVYVRDTARKAAPYIKRGQIIADVAKGIETDTLMTMTEIIEDVLSSGCCKDLPEELFGQTAGASVTETGGIPANVDDGRARLVALSGPTHAEEVSRDLPTMIVAASKDKEAACYVQEVCSNQVMRVYTNDDIRGVEISGALKNIMALAAGIAAGMGYGDNLKAALITRGMTEIARLGIAMGCREQTFAGLAGIGDLIVTATSVHSRNNRAGFLIGQGKSAQEAIREVGMVVEGINALPAAMKLAKQYQIEMPITEAVNKVVTEGMSPEEMFHMLMERAFTRE